ncbi:MAG: flagellar basal body-associated protein FliL, partial [Ilumatobacter sp.]
KEIGELVELEPVNVNLQDGHYLRVAIALEKYKSEEAASDKKKDAGDAPAFPTAPAADLVLSTFSGRAMSELSTNSGREAVRTELFEAIKAVYGDKVTSVYLTEFVMQ